MDYFLTRLLNRMEMDSDSLLIHERLNGKAWWLILLKGQVMVGMTQIRTELISPFREERAGIGLNVPH